LTEDGRADGAAPDEQDAAARDSARVARLLVIWVAVGFVVGIAVLICAIRLDWQ